MIELKDWQDYLPVFALAAVLGAVGGLAYELLQSRRGQTGLIEAPHKGPGKYWDSGWVGSVIVGAIAAVAALWVFPPEVSTTVAAAGKSSTITQYDLIKLVGLSLIVGSAGSSFLSALQARALARAKEQEAVTTKRVAATQIKTISDAVSDGASKDKVEGLVAGAQKALAAIGPDSGPGNPEWDEE